ncbi:MAG: glycerol-3-phosphate dehydrogenase/oxidase [Limnochordales bacterium]|nr:glycerol-3-phosphate dehydrogenase/oxidase [Limnochordales bacterium]
MAALAAEPLDVLIIGGGINGAACARELALAGWRVGLVEKEDFGWGTTARSTRLIHGGLRYLEMFDFRLVRASLREREILLHLAPHLVRPLPFLTPVYKDDPHRFFTVRAGMVLYDLLSYDKSLPTHRVLSRRELLELEPALRPEGLLGGFEYYDAQVAFPERLTVAYLRAAARAGARVVNHAAVHRLLVEEGSEARAPVRTSSAYLGGTRGRVVGAEVVDLLAPGRPAYRVRARVVLNVTGPWADLISRQAIPGYQAQLRLTKGIHLVVPAFLHSGKAMVMLARRDGRLFFSIPWQGFTLVGTTDTDYNGDPDHVLATEEDIRYLQESTSFYFPDLKLEPIYFTTAGLRPLVRAVRSWPGRAPGKDAGELPASAVSRRHVIRDHAAEGAPGLVSVLGGKITDARVVAQDAAQVVERLLGPAPVSRDKRLHLSRTEVLPGGEITDSARQIQRLRALGVDARQAERLVALYGSEAVELVERMLPPGEGDGDGVGQDALLRAEVVWAVTEEMARTTADVLLRRTGLGLRPGLGLDLAPQVSRWVGEILGQGEEEQRRDLDSYRKTVAELLPQQ